MKLLLGLLGGDDRLGRLGDRAVDLLAVRRVLLERPRELVDALLGDVDIEPLQFVAKFLVLLGLADLTLERGDLPFHLTEDIGLAEEVLLGLFDLAERLFTVGLELRDAGGLLENGAPILGLGRENRVDLPLRHDRVGTRPDAGAHQEVLDILQAAGLLIEKVLARAVAVNATLNRDLVILGAKLLFAVGEGDRHLGKPEGLAGIGAVKDDVDKLRAAERRRALFTQDPTNRV